MEELASAAEHFHVERLFQVEPGARLGRLAGADLGQGLVAAEGALDHHLHLATGVLGAEQAGMQHPGVVENQQVTGGEEAGQIGKMQVGQAGLYLQQAAVGAPIQRCLGDQLVGEQVIKVVEIPGHVLMQSDVS